MFFEFNISHTCIDPTFLFVHWEIAKDNVAKIAENFHNMIFSHISGQFVDTDFFRWYRWRFPGYGNTGYGDFKEGIQVNPCQKVLFLHQLTHNMTTDCSLNYKFNTWKFQAQNIGRTCCVQKLILTFRTIYVHNMFSPCSAKIRASDKDLPVNK